MLPAPPSPGPPPRPPASRGPLLRLSAIGASGSGKSTLLAVAGLLLAPDAGRVFLCGEDVTELPEREKARLRAGRIGFVFQAFHLLPARPVLENVLFRFRYLPDPPPPAAARSAAMEALERVGLAAAARRRRPYVALARRRRADALSNPALEHLARLDAGEPPDAVAADYGAL